MTPNQSAEHTARLVGRTLRLLLGIALVWITYSVMRVEDAAFNFRVAALFAGLAAFYTAMHLVINRYFSGVNPWLGAFLAVAPVVLVFVLGVMETS